MAVDEAKRISDGERRQKEFDAMPLENMREANAKDYGYPGGKVIVSPSGKLLAKGGLTKEDKRKLWAKGIDPLYKDNLSEKQKKMFDEYAAKKDKKKKK